MVLFRGLARTLYDAMETAREVNDVSEIGYPCDPSAIECEWYAFDERIYWDTYIISKNGAAIGFTDGPLPGAKMLGDTQAKKAKQIAARNWRKKLSDSLPPMTPEMRAVMVDLNHAWNAGGYKAISDHSNNPDSSADD